MKNEVNRALVAKKKLTILFAALTLSVGLWAETVSYIDATGASQTVNATVISYQSPNTWGTANTTTWYVVDDIVRPYGSVVCVGNVNLILADGAKLLAKIEEEQAGAGIQVSGDGNSLTIYAQSTGAQMGQLIAKGGTWCAGIGGGNNGSGSNITICGGVVEATGGEHAAGIGGGYDGSGSNITILAGTVTANGGNTAAGIGGGESGLGTNITINGGIVTANGGYTAAGIGGGSGGSGSNITINGGTVTATGGKDASGIGAGWYPRPAASNIKVASYIIVKAGDNENPTDEITNTGGDLANDLAGKRYATTEQTANALSIVQTEAIAAIDAAIEGITNTDILAVANQAKTDINAATTVAAVISIKEITLTAIPLLLVKFSVKAQIDAAIVGVTDEDILAIANKAKEDINAAATEEAVNSIKTFALTKINALVLIQTARQGIQNTEINKMIDGAINDIEKGGPDATPGIDEIREKIMTIITSVQIGKEEGQAEAAAALPTDPEGTAGHAVVITKGDKSVTLINPESVSYIKQE